MDRTTPQAFILSGLLHAVVLGALAFAAVLPTCQKPEEVHIFEMVSDAPVQNFSAPSAEPMPQLETQPIPELLDFEPVAIPDIPKPQPIVQPKPKPQPKPVVQPKPKPKPVSYEDFTRENPIEKPRQQPSQPTTRSIDRPVINTDQILRDLNNFVVPQTGQTQVRQMSRTDQSLLTAYRNALRAKIDAAYRKPGGLSGQVFATVVQFSVSSSGTIYDVRIHRSSGNTIFDNSVIAAFQRVGNVGAPPQGLGTTFRLNFEMKD